MIDANADRAAEALRVCGDAARFVLDDADLAKRWREIRGALWDALAGVPGLVRQGLESRDSAGDVGRAYPSPPHRDAAGMARINAHRAQESFRVLEESIRAVQPNLAPRFMELRYKCYDLEIQTLAAMERWSLGQKLDFGLYVVLGNEFSRGRDFLEVAQKAIDGGATAIQLRDKQMTAREQLPWAYKLRELTASHGVTMIVNDHIELALAVDADGVHLGQNDFPVAEARRILGPTKIVGASAHNAEQARRAMEEGASYYNIGPIFPTATKKGGHPPIGPESIGPVSENAPIPFTVMGGIKLDNVDKVLDNGARRVAVVTAVTAADDIAAAARALSAKIDQYRRADPSAPEG